MSRDRSATQVFTRPGLDVVNVTPSSTPFKKVLPKSFDDVMMHGDRSRVVMGVGPLTASGGGGGGGVVVVVVVVVVSSGGGSGGGGGGGGGDDDG